MSPEKLNHDHNLSSSEQSRPDEISLKQLFLSVVSWWRYMLSKWIVILSFSFIGAVIGFFYANSKKLVYKATTTFVLDDGSKGGGGLLGQYAGLASMANLDISGGAGGLFQGDNLIELYQSRTMVQHALLSPIINSRGRKELLIDSYIAINKLRKYWSTKPELKTLRFDGGAGYKNNRLQDSVLSVIVQDIKSNYLTVLKPDKKLNIIYVTVKSGNEDFAINYNNQIVKTVNEFYVQTKTKKSLQSKNLLQHQTDSVKAVLNGNINTTVAITDATPNLNPTRQIMRAPAQRSQFNVEANKAILTQLVQNLELAKMSLLQETPLVQIIDPPVLPLPKEKASRTKATLIGGFVCGFLTVLVLLIRKLFKQIMY